MKQQRLEILRKVANGELTLEQADEQLLRLFSVSQRTFTPTCVEVEDMAVEIDQFISQQAKPMTYSRKLRQYLANKLNEHVG